MATTKKNGAANAAQETLESAAAAQKKTIEDAVQAGTEAFAKGYEQFYTSAREQMDKAQKSASRSLRVAAVSAGLSSVSGPFDHVTR
jgi:hypothetical protein